MQAKSARTEQGGSHMVHASAEGTVVSYIQMRPPGPPGPHSASSVIVGFLGLYNSNAIRKHNNKATGCTAVEPEFAMYVQLSVTFAIIQCTKTC